MIATGSPLELKTGFMHESIIDLRCADPQARIEGLAALPEVREVAVFGAGLHLVTSDPEAAEKAVRSQLASQGLTAFSLETILPSMEDVFISLIEAEDRRGNGQQAPEAAAA
jgi:ABC-2 type transport system ATP-binding protein